jgi:hypothetical protein
LVKVYCELKVKRPGFAFKASDYPREFYPT